MNNALKTQIGEQAKRLREKLGISIEQIANMMQSHSVSVEAFENGAYEPSSAESVNFAQFNTFYFHVMLCLKRDFYKNMVETWQKREEIYRTYISMSGNVEEFKEYLSNAMAECTESNFADGIVQLNDFCEYYDNQLILDDSNEFDPVLQ